MSPTTGYSGTPLSRKLGYREASRVFLSGAPSEYTRLIEPLPHGVRFVKTVNATTDIVHVFVTDQVQLGKFLASCRKKLNPEASVWVSWPKKSSKVPTTVDENVIRELALPLGFVDIKVCAINETWSGLKLVVRKTLR